MTISLAMKLKILKWLAVICWLVAAMPIFAQPIAEWQMDEENWSGASDEVIDASGSGNHGIAFGAQTQSVSPAICGYGHFDGNDYINSTLDMSETAATVSLWFRTSNVNGGLFVAKAGGVTHGAHDRNIYLSGGNVRARLWSEQTISTSGTNYADGNWHHIVFTYGAAIGGQRLYIDGSLAASGTKSSSNFNWQSNVMVGYSQNGYGGFFNGDIDEVLVFDNAMSSPEVTSGYSNQQLGNNWDGSPRVCPTTTLAPVAEYRMDEITWAGVAGEVTDSSTNSYNGTAFGSNTTAGLLCNAGDFSADGIRDYLSLDNSALNGRNDFSISVWAQSANNSNQALVSGSSGSQHNELIMWFPNASTFQPYLKGNGSGGSISSAGINDGDWHHLVWTRAGSQNCLFVDGALRDCKNRSSSALNIANGGLIIGQEQDSLGGSFASNQGWEGLLDEMLIFDNALTASEIASIHNSQQLGNNWDGSPRVCPVSLVPAVEYRMDESTWGGVAGDVIDSSGNGFDATAMNGAQTSNVSPVVAGSPGTCGYGEFDGVSNGSNDYIMLPSGFENKQGSFTITAWINPRNLQAGSRIFADDENNSGGYALSLGDPGSGRLRFYSRSVNPISVDTDNAVISENTWAFVTAVHDAVNKTRQIYVNGIAQQITGTGTSNAYTGNWGVDVGAASIGGETDSGETNNRFTGAIDELRIYDSALNSAQIQDAMNDTRPCSLAPIADWHMDESSWNNTAGEVIDSSINNYNGTAFDSSTTTGLLCNAGDFSANGISDYLSLDNTALNGLTDFSISVWAKTRNSSAQAIVSGSSGSQHNEAIMWFPNASTFQPHLKGSGFGGSVSVSFNDDSWHHLFWTRIGSQNCLYLDGALRDCVTRSSQALTIASGGLIIAQEQDSLGGDFDPNQNWEGLLDELMIFDEGLSATEATQIYTNQLAGNNWDGSPRSCPSASVDHYAIDHAGSTPACLAAGITVRAHDSSDILMQPNAGTTISISSSDGLGTWHAAPSAGGNFVAGVSGQANYTFANGESQVALFLAHPTIANGIDIDVSDGNATDNDGSAEDASIDFVEAGFVFRANNVIDNIGTQLSGKNSTDSSTQVATQTLTLQAVRTDTNTGACVAAIQVPQNVNLGYECRNPSTCVTNGETLNLASSNIQSNSSGSSGNSTTVALVFNANGIAQLGGINYSDAGLIRLHAQANLVANGTNPASTLTGVSNEFVVKPAGLCVQATGVNNTCSSANASCLPFVTAGSDFNLQISGRAWGGSNETNAAFCDNHITPNFDVSPINLTHTLLAPLGGTNGSINASIISIANLGQSNIDQRFSEVGVIAITATAPSNYINNENIDASTSNSIGRFIPAKFSLTNGLVLDACRANSDFTYMGQNFNVSYGLNAVDTTGNVLTNYTGAFAKGMAAGWPLYGAVDTGLAVTSSNRIDASASTTISWPTLGNLLAGQGMATVTLKLNRLTSGLLDGPYTLDLGVQVEDADGVSIEDNLSITVGANNFHSIEQSNQSYGRIRLENAFGSQLLDLPVPVVAEYFDSVQNGFVFNRDDSCTAIVDTQISISDTSTAITEPIIPSDTQVRSPLVLTNLTTGSGEIIFSQSGVDNYGSLDISLNVDTWLKFDWLGTGLVNPTSRITFGTYRGHDRVIYRQEILQ